ESVRRAPATATITTAPDRPMRMASNAQAARRARSCARTQNATSATSCILPVETTPATSGHHPCRCGVTTPWTDRWKCRIRRRDGSPRMGACRRDGRRVDTRGMVDHTDDDLRNSRFTRVDLSGSRLHGVMMQDVKITDAWVNNVEISCL